MKAPKTSIWVAVGAVALSLSLGAPSRATEDEAGTLTLQMKQLYRAGKYKEALPLAQEALALREKEFGRDDANVAMPLNDLGTIHYNLDQYAVAESLYKRALAIREKTLGPDHAEVAMVLNNDENTLVGRARPAPHRRGRGDPAERIPLDRDVEHQIAIERGGRRPGMDRCRPACNSEPRRAPRQIDDVRMPRRADAALADATRRHEADRD